MSTGDQPAPDAVIRQRDQFMERVLQAVSGTFDLFSMYLGHRLGFYHALNTAGPRTVDELAAATSTHARYVRESLEQQTVAGILHVEDDRRPPAERRFRLPDGY